MLFLLNKFNISIYDDSADDNINAYEVLLMFILVYIGFSDVNIGICFEKQALGIQMLWPDYHIQPNDQLLFFSWYQPNLFEAELLDLLKFDFTL